MAIAAADARVPRALRAQCAALLFSLWIAPGARATCIQMTDAALRELDEQLIVDPGAVVKRAHSQLLVTSDPMSNPTHRAALQALLSEGYFQLERDQEAREAATAGLSAIRGRTVEPALQARLRLAEAQPADTTEQIDSAIADVGRLLGELQASSVLHSCALIARARLYNVSNRIDLAVADATTAYREASAGGWAEPRALAAEILGWVYADSGDLDEARDLLNEAITYAETKRATLWLSILHFGYGRLLVREHDWNKASEELRRAIALSESIGDVRGVGLAQLEYCSALVGRADYRSADAACTQAEHELLTTDRTDLRKSVLAMHAQLDRARGQPTAALQSLNVVLDQNGRDVAPKDIGGYFLQRAQAYAALGDFTHAYRDLDTFVQTVRAQDESDRRRSIAVLRTRLETDRAIEHGHDLERQNDFQRTELQMQRQRTALSVAVALFGLTVAVLVAQSTRLRARHTRELGKREAELRTLALHAPDWLMLLNPDLSVRFNNRATAGALLSVPIGSCLPAVLGRDQEALMRRNLDSVLSGSQATVFDFTVTNAEQHELTYECNAAAVLQDAAAVGLAVRCTDVTESRRIEDRRRTQALVLETMHDGVLLIERTGEVRLANTAIRNMLGCAAAELLRANAIDFGIPVEACFATADPEATDVKPPALEFDCRRHDGSRFQARAEFSLISIECETLAICMIQDISERKRLEAQLIEVSSHEQSRIAGDLHDGIGQELTGVALLLRSVADEAGTARRLKEVLNQVIGHVNSAIESTRTLAHGLAPLKLDDGCLGTALGGLAKQAQKLHRLQVETQCDALCAPLAPTMALHLYRIAQEAIANAAKHAHSTRVDVRLESTPTSTVLSIRDNGRGISMSPNRESLGIGLQLMRYRAGLVGGTLHIGSTGERGTEVSCTIVHPAR